MADDKPHDGFVECIEPESGLKPDPRSSLKPEPRITGTVQLFEDGDIVLIPRPTADPRGMLGENIHQWCQGTHY